MKKYEALMILSNTLSNDQLEANIGQVTAEIGKLGGTVKGATRMGRITFARPLGKREAGIYVQVVFFMEPDKVRTLHERFRHKEDLIRLQIVAAKTAVAEPAAAAATDAKKDKPK